MPHIRRHGKYAPVLVFETEQGRGIAGVVDGFATKGVESEADIEDRKNLLRKVIGYKR
jgi:adenosine/AMP kinase